MTPEERRIANIVVRWIKIKTQFEERYDPLKGPTPADIDHSALLERMLEGKEPLPVPPPKQYSYPAYQLVEEDEPQHVHEVWFHDVDHTKVVIEQSVWHIVDRLGEEDYLVEWDYGQRFRLYKDKVKVGNAPNRGAIYARAWVMEAENAHS